MRTSLRAEDNLEAPTEETERVQLHGTFELLSHLYHSDVTRGPLHAEAMAPEDPRMEDSKGLTCSKRAEYSK